MATTLHNERNFDIADELVQAAEQRDTTAPPPSRSPGRAAPGIGPHTPEELQDNLAGIALELPAAIEDRLDTISA
jgi:aryl-alcohol dehydrogenase-like predicted oxidoreductase